MTLYTQNIQGSQDVLKIKDYLVRIIKNSNTHTHTKKKFKTKFRIRLAKTN